VFQWPMSFRTSSNRRSLVKLPAEVQATLLAVEDIAQEPVNGVLKGTAKNGVMVTVPGKMADV